MKNRQLRDCTRRLSNVIDYLQNTNNPAILYFNNAEKAFDQVHWGFLKAVRTAMGFGRRFLQWISLLHSVQTAEIWINGHKSDNFQIEREMRQGCSLSPLLFSISTEVLAIAIRQQSAIKGVQIGCTEHKLILYADNIVFLLSNPALLLMLVKELLIEYGRISGFSVNQNKSTIMGINISVDLQKQIMDVETIPWKKSVKYLGICFSIPLQNDVLTQLNLDPVVKSIQQQLEIWNKLKLSWFGCMAVIKMKVLPRLLFVFLLVILKLTKSRIGEIQKKLEHCIWEGKKSRDKKAVLQQSRKEGGLAFPNLWRYYQASLLENVIQWWNQANKDSWDTEQQNLVFH